jgi:hypothetical protein
MAMTDGDRLAEIKARRETWGIRYFLPDGRYQTAKPDVDWLLAELEAAWKRKTELSQAAADLARPHDCVQRDGVTPLVLYVSPENAEEVIAAFHEIYPNCKTVELP